MRKLAQRELICDLRVPLSQRRHIVTETISSPITNIPSTISSGDCLSKNPLLDDPRSSDERPAFKHPNVVSTEPKQDQSIISESENTVPDNFPKEIRNEPINLPTLTVTSVQENHVMMLPIDNELLEAINSELECYDDSSIIPDLNLGDGRSTTFDDDLDVQNTIIEEKFELQNNNNLHAPEIISMSEESLPSEEVITSTEVRSAGNPVDPDWIPEQDSKISSNSSKTSDEEIEEPTTSQKKKRRKIAEPDEWNDNKNKRKREMGEKYKGWTKRKGETGVRGAERAEREMGPACNSNHCKKTKDCQKIKQEEREAIFNFFWKKMNWDQKKVYVTSLVSGVAPKRRTVGNCEAYRRGNTLQYRLKTQDDKILRVCKKLYLSTLGLKEWTVLSWVKQSCNGMTESTVEKNKTRNSGLKKTNTEKEGLIQFLDELPKLPSHYCRQSTSKVYLEPTFGNNMSDIYREYRNWCTSLTNLNLKAVSKFTFDTVVKQRGIGFQPPKKDRCDTCIGFETKSVSEESFQIHQERKRRAREAKDEDKKAGDQGKCIVLTMDLQAVKVCPNLNASALYYKTKLCVHNFTIFNINSRQCRCYWFNETEADLSANTFASCLVDYLSEILGENTTPIIIWSDGCSYQNRNAILSNALLAFSVQKKVTILQKYLEKGHTQMEADSVHASIEKRLKGKPIYLPSDYVRLTVEARNKPQPYEVRTLDYTFCKNFGVDMVYQSIRPGKSADDPQVTNIKTIKYTPDGLIQVKLDFLEDFIDLPVKRKRPEVRSLTWFPQLHNQRIPIKKSKWLHLQELKKVIPSDCHSFYDCLPRKNN